MILLNIGCGTSLHPDWVNLDLEPMAPGVRRFDLRGGLPFGDASVDACYSSHVLEHLTPAEADRFLAEQRRVLRPGGVMRVVVPDLERIGRHYVEALDGALTGQAGAEMRYDFTLLELFDQVGRAGPGGGLGRWWQEADAERAALALERHGEGARPPPPGAAPRLDWNRAVRGWAKARRLAVEVVARALFGGMGANAVREGFFRQKGEVHRHMYDRFSLGRLLVRHRFLRPRVCAAHESALPGFDGYGLDRVDGRVRKPDSLFMEAEG